MFDYSPRIMKTKMEHALTPLSFISSPSISSSCPGPLTGRKADGEANPRQEGRPSSSGGNRRHVGNYSSLNLFRPNNGIEDNENIPITPRRRGTMYHNMETTSSLEFPSKGIRRIAPQINTPRAMGLRTVDSQHNSQRRNITVVGDPYNQRNNTQDFPAYRPLTNVSLNSVSHRPLSASAPVKNLLHMNETFGSTDPKKWGCPNDNIKFKPKQQHDVSLIQKVRLAVCDHVAQRKGGIADFFFALCRGVVGHVKGLELPQGAAGTANFESIRVQLSALLNINITSNDLAVIIFSPLLEEYLLREEEDAAAGRISCDEYTNEGRWGFEGFFRSRPESVTFRDFTKAFGDGPKISLLRAHKI
eukprot:Tbor_TRINITY_DN3996_c0_g1::TRINITY_DN3996_c0_g1_i3::g.863::m.863